jgi:hypothetical protein
MKQRQQQRRRQGEQEEQSEQQQADLRGCTVSHPSEAWGDALTKKHDNVCRIGLLNLMGFTV